jgi:MarR family transcriptional regulator for hemolysin
LENLIKKLAVIYRLAGANLGQRLKGLGVTSGQMMYIMCVCENQGISQEGLSQELRIDKGAVARAVKKLEQDGYVVRTVAQDDRRQYQVFPTEKSEALYVIAREQDWEWQAYMTRGMTPKEEETLNRLLDRMLENLKD